MAVPDSNQVLKRRYWALVIVRAASLCLIVYGSFEMLHAFGTFFGYGTSGTAFLSGFGTFWGNNFNPFWYGLALSIPGVVLAISSRRIARWLVPAPFDECANCGYPLKSLGASRCPECGYRIESVNDGQAPAS